MELRYDEIYKDDLLWVCKFDVGAAMYDATNVSTQMIKPQKCLVAGVYIHSPRSSTVVFCLKDKQGDWNDGYYTADRLNTKFAKTKEESVELFNNMVQNVIEKYYKVITQLESKKIIEEIKQDGISW